VAKKARQQTRQTRVVAASLDPGISILHRIAAWLPWACVLALMPSTIHNVIGWGRILTFPGEANFGEGVLLYEGWRHAHGLSIYLDPAKSPYWIATYPPLYQLLVAAGGAHSFIWQRLVSLIAGLVCTGSLALVVRRLTGAWSIALLSGLLWVNSLFVDTWFVFGRTDMTGRAFCSAAVACIVCVRRERLAFAAALVCSILAMLVKQNMITGGLVCIAVLFTRSRRQSAVFAACWIAAVACAYLAINIATHGWFWRDIFTYTSREIQASLLWTWLSGFAAAHWPYFVAAALGVVLVYQKQIRAGVLVAALIAGMPNALLSGNDGSDRNYFFDVIWPLCGLAAIGVGAAATASQRARALLNAAGACAAATAVLVLAVLLVLAPSDYPTPGEKAAARQIIEKLRASRKPVLCELTGYTMLAGSEVDYLPYMLRKLEEDGRWNPQPMVQRIASRQYGAILITSAAQGRFGPAVLQAIDENYEVSDSYHGPVLADGKDALLFLTPRS
jgi:hypothetical protein